MPLELAHINFRLLLKQRRMLLSGICGAVIGIAMILMVGIPEFMGIFETRERLSSESVLLETLQKKVVQVRELASVPGFTHKDQIDELLPNEKPVVPFMSGVSLVVTQMELPVGNMSITPGRLNSLRAVDSRSSSAQLQNTQAVKGEIMMSFQTSGKISQLYELINKIEKSAPMSVVTQIRLSKKVPDNFSPISSSTSSSTASTTNQDGPANTTDEDELLTAAFEVTGNYFVDKAEISQDEAVPLPGEKELQFISGLAEFTFPQSEFPAAAGGSTLQFGDLEIKPQQ